jgi:prolyl-tRNA synthetase
MRWSQSLIPTQKQPPADAPSPGHALLARAGMIHFTRAGGISFLPLGLRTLNKLADALRETLGDLNFQEVLLNGEAGSIAASMIRSHRQLPQNLFQFTHNPSPQLSTISFHPNPTSRQKAADTLAHAISALLKKLSIPTVTARTPEGQSLAVLSEHGKDELLATDSGDYVATPDAAEIAPRPSNFAGEPTSPLERISTPGLTTVADVCAFLNIAPSQILKTLVFAAQSPIATRWVVAVVRGDHQVNLRKLSAAAQSMGVTSLGLADITAAKDKWAMGFVGPDAAIKTPDAVMIVDPDAAQGPIPWAAGANEVDTHVRNFNWFRECGDRLADPTKVTVADIRDAVDGDLSPFHSALHLKSASILLSQSLLPTDPHLAFDDIGGEHRSLSLSDARLDLAEVLIATANACHDDDGLLWPRAIAPSSAVITAIQYEGSVRDAADSIYTRLTFDGIDAILDDRDIRAGPKFADSDLIGFPVRITIGPKTVENAQAEIKLRTSPQLEAVPLSNVPARVSQMLMDS